MSHTLDSPSINYRGSSHNRTNQSSITLGSDEASFDTPTSIAKPILSSPAGIPSDTPKPMSRRHTYMGGSSVAALLGGSEITPPQSPYSPVTSQVTSPESKRRSFGITPQSTSPEVRRQTRRLMPDHQNGFTSTVFKSDFDKPPIEIQRAPRTPPALRSNVIFGGDNDALMSSPPRRSALPSKATESSLVLGDDGGDSLQLKKRNSYRKMITPPHLTKKQSLADFIGAPAGAIESVEAVKPKADPASVEIVAGKATGKHRVY